MGPKEKNEVEVTEIPNSSSQEKKKKNRRQNVAMGIEKMAEGKTLCEPDVTAIWM